MTKLPRPQIIDEADGPCEICAEWRANKDRSPTGRCCDECGKPLDQAGAEGVAAHHFHLRLINGAVPGRVAMHQELCQECNKAHRLLVYPPKELKA